MQTVDDFGHKLLQRKLGAGVYILCQTTKNMYVFVYTIHATNTIKQKSLELCFNMLLSLRLICLRFSELNEIRKCHGNNTETEGKITRSGSRQAQILPQLSMDLTL